MKLLILFAFVAHFIVVSCSIGCSECLISGKRNWCIRSNVGICISKKISKLQCSSVIAKADGCNDKAETTTVFNLPEDVEGVGQRFSYKDPFLIVIGFILFILIAVIICCLTTVLIRKCKQKNDINAQRQMRLMRKPIYSQQATNLTERTRCNQDELDMRHNHSTSFTSVPIEVDITGMASRSHSEEHKASIEGKRQKGLSGNTQVKGTEISTNSVCLVDCYAETFDRHQSPTNKTSIERTSEPIYSTVCKIEPSSVLNCSPGSFSLKRQASLSSKEVKLEDETIASTL